MEELKNTIRITPEEAEELIAEKKLFTSAADNN